MKQGERKVVALAWKSVPRDHGIAGTLTAMANRIGREAGNAPREVTSGHVLDTERMLQGLELSARAWNDGYFIPFGGNAAMRHRSLKCPLRTMRSWFADKVHRQFVRSFCRRSGIAEAARYCLDRSSGTILFGLGKLSPVANLRS